jgi:adenylate cyclase
MFAEGLRYLRRLHRTAYLGLAAALPALLFGWLYYYECTNPRPLETHLTRAELTFGDLFRYHGRPTPLRPDLVFLGIDNASLSLDSLWPEEIAASPALKLISDAKGAWNWSREVYALVLERLVNAGARVVLFDLTMPKPNTGDDAFRAALDRDRDHVVIAWEIGESANQANVSHSANELTNFLPSSTLIAHPAGDPRVGYATYQPDADGIVRQMSFAVTQQALEGLAARSTDTIYWSFVAQALRQMGRADLIPAQIRPRLFRYTDLPHGKGYAPRSLYEIFVADLWKQN